MVTSFITYCDSDKSLEGKLGSLVNVVVWDYYDTTDKFSPNGWHKVKVPNIHSTELSKFHDRKAIEQAVISLKEHIVVDFNQRIVNKHNKKEKLRSKKEIESIDKKIYLMENFIENIDEEIKLLGPFGNGNYKVYNVRLPPISSKLVKRYLSKYFTSFMNPTNYSLQIKMQLNYPFSIIEFHNKKLKVTNKVMPLRTLQKAPLYSLDYEATEYLPYSVREGLSELSEERLKEIFLDTVKIYNFELKHDDLRYMTRKDYLRGIDFIFDSTRDERLTGVVFASLQENVFEMYGTVKFDKKKMTIPNPWINDTSHEFNITTFSDQKKMIEALNKNFKGFFVAGHYHIFYDYDAGDRLTGVQRLGVGETKAKHIGQIIDYRKTKTLPGRFDIDPSSYSQKVMKNYSNRMDVVGLNVSGIRTKKTLNHAELEIITRKALKGDLDAAHKFYYYMAGDGLKSIKMCTDIQGEHLILSRDFKSQGARIDATGMDSFTQEYWYMNHFKRTKSYPFEKIKTFSFGEGNAQIRYKDIRIQDLVNTLIKPIFLQSKKGLFDAYMVDLFPLVEAFKPLLSKDSEVEKLYKFADASNDDKRKTRVYRWLNNLAKYPLFYALKYKENSRAEKYFGMHFGIKRNEPGMHELLNRFDNNLKKVNEILYLHPSINYNGETFLFPSVMPFTSRDYILKDIGVVRGKGLFISGTKGRFAGNIDNELTMIGIADFGSKKGERSIFEKNIYKNFFTKLLLEKDYEGTFNYLVNRIKLFHDGQLTKEELQYERTAKRDHTGYASGATQGFINELVKQQAMRGDKISYDYDYERLLTKFFGLMETNEPDELDDLFGMPKKPIFSIDADRGTKYYCMPQSQKGTISELLNWIFRPEDNSVEQELLSHLYLGNATDNTIKRLSYKYRQIVNDALKF